MPFDDDLNYFYLYLKEYIESNYALDIERGDTKRLTRPIMEKVMAQIRDARLIIADITGANANVLYEVGLAHAQKKPILFLSQDSPEDAPIDVRHFDIISYRTGDSDQLLKELNVALREELAEQFADFFDRATELLTELNSTQGTSISAASKDVFHQRIGRATSSQRTPRVDDAAAIAEFLLPKIVEDSTDMSVIRSLTAWMDTKYE